MIEYFNFLIQVNPFHIYPSQHIPVPSFFLISTFYSIFQISTITDSQQFIFWSKKFTVQPYTSTQVLHLFQIQKTAQLSPSIYINQVQSSRLAAQAQEAFAAAQRTAPTPSPVYKPRQPAAQTIAQPVVQPQQQYYREQQPQVRYVQRPAASQYRLAQPQQQLKEDEQEKDDYDVSTILFSIW